MMLKKIKNLGFVFKEADDNKTKKTVSELSDHGLTFNIQRNNKSYQKIAIMITTAGIIESVVEHSAPALTSPKFIESLINLQIPTTISVIAVACLFSEMVLLIQPKKHCTKKKNKR